MKLSHGIKSALLDGKLRTGTSKTKKSHAWLVEIALFWRLLHTFCHPAWRILYHVTVSCKESILQQPYWTMRNDTGFRLARPLHNIETPCPFLSEPSGELLRKFIERLIGAWQF